MFNVSQKSITPFFHCSPFNYYAHKVLKVPVTVAQSMEGGGSIWKFDLIKML